MAADPHQLDRMNPLGASLHATGATFRVWAPDAAEVAVALPDGEHALHRGEGGTFEADLPTGPGEDYMFVLDGRHRLPDPWSRSQRHGLRGPSRVVDPARVTYVRNPLMDDPASGLVGDRAYWVSGIETRDRALLAGAPGGSRRTLLDRWLQGLRETEPGQLHPGRAVVGVLVLNRGRAVPREGQPLALYSGYAPPAWRLQGSACRPRISDSAPPYSEPAPPYL